jgi:hypothetical protein
MTGDPAYTRSAVKAMAAAVDAEHDFPGWLAAVLARTAAHAGSADALTAGRPGSWEAALVQQLLAGTVGENDEYLPDPGKDRIMTTCDPSRRPDQATQMMALEVVRRFVTIGSFGAADAVHDLAADAGCPACVITSVTQFMLAVVAAVSGDEYVTEELSGRILALVDATQAELDAAANLAGAARRSTMAVWPRPL